MQLSICLIFLGGASIWIGGRLPNSIRLGEGSVTLGYPGLRFDKKLGSAEIKAVRITDRKPLYVNDKESWLIELLPLEGDEIYLTEKDSAQEAEAFAGKISAAAAKPLERR